MRQVCVKSGVRRRRDACSAHGCSLPFIGQSLSVADVTTDARTYKPWGRAYFPYDFLSQLVSYDDADLERLHAFCRMLLPRLQGKAGGDEALDQLVRLAGYKLVNEQKHTLSMEAGKAEAMKPMGPGGGQTWEDPEDRLSAVIKKMNEVFAGNFPEADFRGYATTLIGKLVDDTTLQEQAQANDTVDAFSNGAYETKLNNAVVDALENHGAMADQALRHETVFKGLASLLVDEVYRQLRQEVRA